MDTSDAGDLHGDGRSVDHLTLEDGSLVLYDPGETDAWIQCRSPVALHRIS